MELKQKKCMKCGELKPLSAFYEHPQMKDGHLNKCKECTKKDVSNNYRKNKKHYQEYEHSDKRIASRRSRSGRYLKNHREKNPEKNRARRILTYHVRKGNLTQPSVCSICGKESKYIQGHHEDYSKPLDVIWVCPQCHRNIHNNRKE